MGWARCLKESVLPHADCDLSLSSSCVKHSCAPRTILSPSILISFWSWKKWSPLFRSQTSLRAHPETGYRPLMLEVKTYQSIRVGIQRHSTVPSKPDGWRGCGVYSTIAAGTIPLPASTEVRAPVATPYSTSVGNAASHIVSFHAPSYSEYR